MGLRFRKSIKIAPGIRLGIGTGGASLSFGGKGCRYSINTRGRSRVSAGPFSFSSSSKKRRSRSYNSSAYAKQAKIKKELQKQKLEELEKNKLIVEQYETYVDMIQNVHRECDESINWNNIANEPEPFPKGMPGPKEQEAQKQHANFKPRFYEKWLPSMGDKRNDKLKDAVATARQDDLEDYETWEESISFAKRILSGDIEGYYEAIQEANPFEDLTDFGSGFEFGTENPQVMEIEFMVKSEDVVPKTSKSLTKTGKVSEKNLTKTMYYDITQDYVCSCSIRLAREIFALLPVQRIIVHATDTILNTATGHDEEQTILSVGFTREEFENTDFDRIDASDFVERFQHNMNFKKTGGFSPINRLSL